MTEIIHSAADVIRDMTAYTLMPLWMENFAENLPYIRKNPSYINSGLDAFDLPKSKKPAIIIGAGPSLSVYKHLSVIKRLGWKHDIFVCDKMLGEALRMGIKPNYVATVDGSPLINNFFIRKEVKKHAKDITGVFNVLTHPSVIQSWINAGGKPWWFVSAFDEPKDGKLSYRSLTNILHLISGRKGTISGMGNVGAFLWNLAVGLDCSPIILVGFDFSEQLKNKADAVYFGFYVQWFLQRRLKAGADPGLDYGKLAQDDAANIHQPEQNPDFISPFTKSPCYKKGEHPWYIVNPIWKYYRDSLAMYISGSKVHTINCTGNGCIHTEAYRWELDPLTKEKKKIFILKIPNFEAMPLEEAIKQVG